VGQHPHRGFETVTIAFQGEIEHADSAGNRDVIKKGDVQWMTAGRGIIHEEFHGTEWAKTGGTVEMVQLWVNLKSKDKMVAPRYQPLSNEAIPSVDLSAKEEDGVRKTTGSLRVVAGSYGDSEGPAETYSEMNVWDIALRETRGHGVQLSVPEGHNTLLLVRSGSIDVLDHQGEITNVKSEQVVMFNMDGNAINIASIGGPSNVLLLSGVPFDEPIANMGPFVMNTRAELSQAQRDYSSGNFGT
jgi:redox-sensitive bicupin YhaK (pirin superfamily)